MTLKNIDGNEAEQRNLENEKYLNTGKEQAMLKRHITLINSNKYSSYL